MTPVVEKILNEINKADKSSIKVNINKNNTKKLKVSKKQNNKKITLNNWFAEQATINKTTCLALKKALFKTKQEKQYAQLITKTETTINTTLAIMQTNTTALNTITTKISQTTEENKIIEKHSTELLQMNALKAFLHRSLQKTLNEIQEQKTGENQLEKILLKKQTKEEMQKIKQAKKQVQKALNKLSG